MDAVEKATETQLQNIQKRSGKTLEQLFDFIRSSGLTRHAEIREMLKSSLKMGYGDANILAHVYLKSLEEQARHNTEVADMDPLDEIYSGNKAVLRPLHDTLMEAIESIGPFEISPKKGYLSLRRRKQFVMLGPGSKSRLELGLNIKGIEATPRLSAMPPGGMCQYKVWLIDPVEVDGELLDWVKMAYEEAG